MKILEYLNPGNTLTCNRYLAHIIGAAAALIYGALISKQIYYQKHSMLDADGWFYSTADDLKESTSFSKCQQERAIKILVKNGLIDYKIGGMPARRCFRVRDDTELVEKLLAVGRKADNKKSENLSTGCKETEQQADRKSDGKLEENRAAIYNHNIETKINNHNLSIISDGIDEIDERSAYLEIIKSNIEYDCFSEKERVDELVEIMLDVICSGKEHIRVNGADVPQSMVKSRFLKLDNSHIEYVLMALNKNTTDVRNVRSYIITALYNAPTTMDSYYGLMVNHDLYGQ